MTQRGNSIGHIVDTMPGKYTVSQAAAMVGRSVDTLRRWREEGVFVPASTMTNSTGGVIAYLYSEEDIVALRKIAAEMKPGPKHGA